MSDIILPRKYCKYKMTKYLAHGVHTPNITEFYQWHGVFHKQTKVHIYSISTLLLTKKI